MWLISILSIEVDPLHLDQKSENLDLFLFLQGYWQEVPGITGILQDTWSIAYIMLMKSVVSPLPFSSEVYKHVEINTGEFSDH